MGYSIIRKERFGQIGSRLAEKMAELTLNGKWIFTLLLLNIDRNSNTWEPTYKSNPFRLVYKDYVMFGVARSSFNVGVVELIDKKFIRIIGKQRKKMCKIIEW